MKISYWVCKNFCSYCKKVPHVYITYSKFNAKPHLGDIFQISGIFVLFSNSYSFHLYCFKNFFMWKFTISIFKAKLGGDIFWSNVIMHKGYSELLLVCESWWLKQLSKLKQPPKTFQHFPRLSFWWVIIPTVYQSMLQSWCLKAAQSLLNDWADFVTQQENMKDKIIL